MGTARRSNVTFAPKDTQQVQEWEEELKTESNPLVKYLESWKTLQERKDEEGDDHGEEKKPKKKRKLAKTTDKKAMDVKKKKKKKKHSQENEKRITGTDDVVEDLVF